jgi:hypothetical protein
MSLDAGFLKPLAQPSERVLVVVRSEQRVVPAQFDTDLLVSTLKQLLDGASLQCPPPLHLESH